MREITVHWEVNDGYVGKSSPQKTTITEFELGMFWDEFDKLSKNVKKKIINELVQEDFENKISLSINSYDFGL